MCRKKFRLLTKPCVLAKKWSKQKFMVFILVIHRKNIFFNISIILVSVDGRLQRGYLGPLKTIPKKCSECHIIHNNKHFVINNLQFGILEAQILFLIYIFLFFFFFFFSFEHCGKNMFSFRMNSFFCPKKWLHHLSKTSGWSFK